VLFKGGTQVSETLYNGAGTVNWLIVIVGANSDLSGFVKKSSTTRRRQSYTWVNNSRFQ